MNKRDISLGVLIATLIPPFVFMAIPAGFYFSDNDNVAALVFFIIFGLIFVNALSQGLFGYFTYN